MASLLFAGALLAGQGSPQGSAPAKRERTDLLTSTLDGTERALATLRDYEERLARAPDEVVPLLLRVTEAPRGTPEEQAARLAALRAEVEALLAELDELQASLAARARAADEPGAPAHVAARPAPRVPATSSADPLRQGIACYRAGRFEEACRILAPLDEARACYWRARALERLERFDEAIQAMERAVALDGEGFERRRAATDLELLRWKRDYANELPGAQHSAADGRRTP